MTDVLLTLLVGTLGGVVAIRFRLPGGAIIGALFATATLHMLVTGLDALSPAFRTAAQIAIGGAIGATLTRSPLRAVARVFVPAMVAIGLLLGASIGLAFLVHYMTDLPSTTALFSLAPGGASDMASAALKLDVDVALIAAIHVVRQIAVFMILVGAFARLLKR
jgi:membrane AbrB-like protein